jgi:UDP:flavonoid glycosyltransferase YjiC (YdhE family)
MATVLFTWQLGAGLGHVMQMLPLAQGLIGRGQKVYIAFRNLSVAASVFGQTGIHFLQAPFKSDRRPFYPRTISFAHLLGNTGFGEDKELFALAASWRNLYRLIQPDVIVFDHSPVALLAARGIPARRALIGTGFFCPPDTRSLPVIARRSDVAADSLAADEQRILRRANWMLEHWNQPPLERLGQLYSQVDQNFLTTFSELDHYGPRPGVRYWGPVNASGGKLPDWPAAAPGRSPKRIYAYLKRFPALTEVLQALRDRGNPTLVYPDGIDGRTRKQYESETLRFESERLDPGAVAAECDVAILNANHGSASGMLLAGKPLLQIPLFAEQRLLAEAICRTGAAKLLSAARSKRDDVEQALDQLLSQERFEKAASQFAMRYATFDPARQRSEMLDAIYKLLAKR